MTTMTAVDMIEESPISLGLIQSLREQSINVTPYKPDTDKRARLIAQTDLFEGGSVRFPERAVGLRNSLPSCSLFPVGTTIRLMPSPKALLGVARAGAAGPEHTRSRGCINVLCQPRAA